MTGMMNVKLPATFFDGCLQNGDVFFDIFENGTDTILLSSYRLLSGGGHNLVFVRTIFDSNGTVKEMK